MADSSSPSSSSASLSPAATSAENVGPPAPKSTAKLDRLRDIEVRVQRKWNETRAFEKNAPEGQGAARSAETYVCTFPYPYMNGRLHLGHAFTILKADFSVGYERLKGKTCLFPFGFHCTGMPIKASADKLVKELELFGNPPVYPPPPEETEEEKIVKGQQDTKSAKKKKGGKKPNAKAKTKGSKLTYQGQIMGELGIPPEDLEQFADPNHWCHYFPPKAIEDLKKLGCPIDWRRSFITTDLNPFYDSFVRWQMIRLKEKNKIKFGKRYTVFSPKDGQPCMDHERKKGEGLSGTDYTLIKIKVITLPEALKVCEGKDVFLVAGTLRPETMYGQTNCYVSPTITYVAWETKDGEVFITTRRAARNASYQEITKEWGVVPILCEVHGKDLMGLPLKAPLSGYDVVYSWPMMTILENKGTGVVTSVPSDSPDDFATMRDLKNKPKLRDMYGIKDEMIMPYDPIPVLQIEGYPECAAVKACDDHKVKSQNDREKLDKAKDDVYKLGFAKGVMSVGDFKGQPVKDAKDKIEQLLLDRQLGIKYQDPEGLIISRSDDECVIALCDQWFLDYGEPAWRAKADECLQQMECYDELTKQGFKDTLDWLHQHACSRTYGLGTRMPWDESWLVESLSDSTIYMAYYTVAHFLQGGTLDSSLEGSLGIQAEQMTPEVWDYIFTGIPVSNECLISKEKLDTMRNEFCYWYPMNLRVSGKDLIPNHLTYCIYNHVAIWDEQPEYWPKSMRGNGHLQLNGEKMSKSEGNFLTLAQSVEKFGADATRMALADAGDFLEDGNFEESVSNALVLTLFTELEWVIKILKGLDSLRTGALDSFADRAFLSEISFATNQADDFYSKMQYRNALKAGFYDLQNARNRYLLVTEHGIGIHRDLICHFIKIQYLLLSPITPHMSEEIWRLLGNDSSVLNASWPDNFPVDSKLILASMHLHNCVSDFRKRIDAYMKPKKGKKAAPPPTELPKSCTLYVRNDYPEWKRRALSIISKALAETGEVPDNRSILGLFKKDDVVKSKMKVAMPFVTFMKELYEKQGPEAFSETPTLDEISLFQDNKDYIMRSLGITDLNIKLIDGTDDEKVIENTEPMKPWTIFS
eukprot:UC4_evm1s553